MTLVLPLAAVALAEAAARIAGRNDPTGDSPAPTQTEEPA